MPYCDGNSFSGNRDDAVVVNGKPLYFRGRRVMDAVLESLLPLGLAEAEPVEILQNTFSDRARCIAQLWPWIVIPAQCSAIS